MRTIKFRAWAHGSMWNVNALACSDGSDSMDLIDDSIGGYEKVSDFDEVETRVLMQYTGLKDKNGKEIYEGDIVLNDDSQRAIVRYDESNAHYYLDLYELMGSSFCVGIEKVIGNIHENPELIEEESA